ncbi:MAG TPA: hypothetical protein VFY48_07100 [Solirubrobacterales bacterium]|nr:hypothetical protein [Solirubrobacterales bacterium]
MVIRPDLSGKNRDEFIEEARRLFERWGLKQSITLLEQPVGKEPDLTLLHGSEIAKGDRTRLLLQARLVELQALLEWSEAIWRPKTYHYLLPSGEHAGEYIRLADAIREPRDAEVLASWLNRSLVDRMGFVIDTGVLNPVVLASIRNMERAGLTPNPVAVLDQYPRTSADVDSAINFAASPEGNVLALLSISSTGAVLDRLFSALEGKRPSLKQVSLQVMIRKSSSPLPETIDVWSPLQGEVPIVEEGFYDTTCDLCRSADKARICPISPRTLDEMLPSQLRLTTPSVAKALDNKEYWEIADAKQAVRVEAHPHPAIGFHRPSMPIAVRIERMLTHAELSKGFLKRVKSLHDEGLDSDPDIVLVPQHELEFKGWKSFWGKVRHTLAPRCAKALPFPVDEDGLSAEVKEKVRDAERVLVFCLGTVTGVLLQRGLMGVQTAKEDPDFALQGLVMHSRPATEREWKGLTNGYGYEQDGQRRLFCAWKTLLPDRSPLRDELALLEELDDSELEKSVIPFWEKRLSLCGGGSGSKRPPLFWGARDKDRLTPNAIFGEALSARATFAAVGAAMEQARAIRPADSPEYRVFELSAVFRSYYDPLLVASLLRWLRPHESWWGWQWSDCERTVSHLVTRMPLDQRRIVVPELLLAAAQGKVGPSAIPHLRACATDLLPAVSGQQRAAIKLGLHIAPVIDEDGLKAD